MLQVASPAVLTLRHRDVQHWQDSTIVTPEGAARFAREFADDIESAGGKTLLAVN